MGIVDLFRPKHRHSDARVRLAAVRAMSSDDSTLLATIARTDKDTAVRRVAIEKLEDVDVLADVFERETEGELRDLAGSRAAELWVSSACQDEDEELARNALAGLIRVGDQKALAEVANRAAVHELRGKALAELREPRALAEVARTTTSPELRGKALARLDDQATLRGLATDATVKELGLAVVDRMTSVEMLETVAQKAKNKAVRQRARRKIDELQATPAAGGGTAGAAGGAAAPAPKVAKIPDELLRRRAEKAQVLRSVEALADHVEWVQSLETVKKAEREWERLGDTGEPAIDQRFNRAVRHYHEHRESAQRSLHEREAEIVASAQARRDAEDRAAAERAERAARRARERDRDEEDGDVVNQAAMALMKPAPLTDEQRAARDAELAKRREAQDKRRAEDQARRAEESAAREARQKEQVERGASIARSLRALIDEMGALADSKDSKAIDRLLGQAATAFGQLAKAPPADRDELEQRYREARGKLVVKLQEAREGEDWKRWSNVPRAENLVAAVKELAEREEQPTIDILKELQRLWKELGPLPQKKSQELWEQFKSHADAAFGRIRQVRDVDRAKMDEHAKAREALIAEAEGLAESTDWETTAAALKELQAKWKATGPVPRKQGDELWKRFRAACDRFFERRKPLLDAQHAELDANLAAKRRLIERAEALVARAPSDKGWGADIGVIKDLQREWKEIGHVPRAEVERVWQAFRAACDGLFAKRDSARDAEGNARRAELDAMKAELEEVTAAAAAADGEAVARALATRKKFLELRTREGELGAELNELFEELLKTVVVIHGNALKGTDIDPTAMASKRSKLIGRVSDLMPDEAPTVAADAPAATIAEQLKAAMSQNALFRGDGRNPLEALEEIEAEWRAVGPVLGRDAERQAERFAELCADVRARSGEGTERRGGGERRGERRGRPDRRRGEDGGAPMAVPETIVSEAVTTPVLPPVEPRPATTPPPAGDAAKPAAEARRPAPTRPPGEAAKPAAEAAKPAAEKTSTTSPSPSPSTTTAVKPAVEAKPATAAKPSAEVKPAAEATPAVEARRPAPTRPPVEGAKPAADAAKPAAEAAKPAAEAKPVAEIAKPAAPKPAVEAKPVAEAPSASAGRAATTARPAVEAAASVEAPAPVAASVSGAMAAVADSIDDDWGELDDVPDMPASPSAAAAAEALVSAAAKKSSGATTLPAAKPVAASPAAEPTSAKQAEASPAAEEPAAATPAATDDGGLDDGWG